MEKVVDESLRDAFREVMAGTAAPVSVVTSIAGGSPHGTTVSAFASLSLDPPMTLIALDRASQLLQVIVESKSFGVNILGAAQSAIAAICARKGPAKRLSDVTAWQLDHGIPRLADATGWLACEVAELLPGGDHVIVVGTVVAAETTDGPPLIYHQRRFGTHAVLDAAG